MKYLILFSFLFVAVVVSAFVGVFCLFTSFKKEEINLDFFEKKITGE